MESSTTEKKKQTVVELPVGALHAAKMASWTKVRFRLTAERTVHRANARPLLIAATGSSQAGGMTSKIKVSTTITVALLAEPQPNGLAAS
jgi:hypothetical protein